MQLTLQGHTDYLLILAVLSDGRVVSGSSGTVAKIYLKQHLSKNRHQNTLSS